MLASASNCLYQFEWKTRFVCKDDEGFAKTKDCKYDGKSGKFDLSPFKRKKDYRVRKKYVFKIFGLQLQINCTDRSFIATMFS